jgi:serine/threonine-protein kinase
LRAEESAFYDGGEITAAQVGRVSLYHTSTGVECVRAQIAAARGDLLTCQNAVDEFIRLSEGRCESLDLTLGYSGILLGCALLLEALRSVPAGRDEALRAAGNRLRDKIWNDPRFAADRFIRKIKYLGVAHGVAGILYATLRFSRAAGEPPPPDIMIRLKQLADAGLTPAGDRAWPVLYGQDRFVGGWCNGTAGFVHLWCEAADALGDASFLDLAAEASVGMDIRQNGPVSHLCCGTAGQGFAFLRLYSRTGDKRWQAAARDCLPAAADPARFFLNGEHSLYKGEIGLLSLAAGLMKPASVGMPLFD